MRRLATSGRAGRAARRDASRRIQAAGRADVDADGAGEFGFFRELSGAHGVRTSADRLTVGAVMNPPVLSGAFRTMDSAGAVSRSGYLFGLRLPTNAGGAAGESPTAGFSNLVNANYAETLWCGYAWPASYATSGNRTFFVNQAGDITGTDFASYSGPGAGSPPPAAAYRTGTMPFGMTGRVAIGVAGLDGNVWKQIN